jgi:hypothetical protein
MTEFTKDDIEHYRKQYALWTSRGRITPEELHLIGRLRDALDHIERLQSRVQEVEDNREYIEMLLCKAEKHIAELEETISQDTKVNVAHIALLNSDIAEL